MPFVPVFISHLAVAMPKRLANLKRDVRDELANIAKAQTIATSLSRSINEVRQGRGLGPLSTDDPGFFAVLVEEIKKCVTYKEIDDAARELYGN